MMRFGIAVILQVSAVLGFSQAINISWFLAKNGARDCDNVNEVAMGDKIHHGMPSDGCSKLITEFCFCGKKGTRDPSWTYLCGTCEKNPEYSIQIKRPEEMDEDPAAPPLPTKAPAPLHHDPLPPHHPSPCEDGSQ